MKIGSLQEATKLIQKYDSIVIFHHIRPDGDCLGSQAGLAELIRVNFPCKKVYTVGNSEGMFGFLNLKFDKCPSDSVLKKSLAIVPDANFKDRIQCREILDKNLFAEVLRIDHHPNDDDLDKCTRWVESNRIAAAEMVADLAYTNKWKVTIQAANCIFTGIVTDSGGFRYGDTSSRTHFLASFLYECGLESDKVFLGMAATPLDDLKINQTLLNNLKTVGKVAYTTIDLETTKKLGKKPNQVVRVNLIGNIIGYPFWVQFNEEEDGRIRVEFRSNGPCVRNVAVKWGGGGHERASGAMIKTWSELDAVIKDCNSEVDRWEIEGNENQQK
ncbi:bifunctional oligoribonuclease/PAP phosphatase NrnA [Mycoplasmopsis caviae]|nr:bifunctional oligoribonuclease/PAP phosphatase NrnA [Mycoplasmopsis caviae]UUD35322.1 bifunctional oligoribonuclease/PAP phosphatase NrnA [Mycoplasmopsis caviae]